MKASVSNSNSQLGLPAPTVTNQGVVELNGWTVVKSKNNRKKNSNIADPRNPQVGRSSESKQFAIDKSGIINLEHEKRKKLIWMPAKGNLTAAPSTVEGPSLTGDGNNQKIAGRPVPLVLENSLQVIEPRPVIFSGFTEAGTTTTGLTTISNPGNDAILPGFAQDHVEKIPGNDAILPGFAQDHVEKSRDLAVVHASVPNAFSPIRDENQENQVVVGEGSISPKPHLVENPSEMVELDLNGEDLGIEATEMTVGSGPCEIFLEPGFKEGVGIKVLELPLVDSTPEANMSLDFIQTDGLGFNPIPIATLAESLEQIRSAGHPIPKLDGPCQALEERVINQTSMLLDDDADVDDGDTFFPPGFNPTRKEIVS